MRNNISWDSNSGCWVGKQVCCLQKLVRATAPSKGDTRAEQVGLVGRLVGSLGCNRGSGLAINNHSRQFNLIRVHVIENLLKWGSCKFFPVKLRVDYWRRVQLHVSSRVVLLNQNPDKNPNWRTDALKNKKRLLMAFFVVLMFLGQKFSSELFVLKQIYFRTKRS